MYFVNSKLYFLDCITLAASNSNLKKPSQAIYVPPQRKSSSTKSQNNKDEDQEPEKQKPKVDTKTNVITLNRKKSARVEMRKFHSTGFA